jgi:hypothetical protein
MVFFVAAMGFPLSCLRGDRGRVGLQWLFFEGVASVRGGGVAGVVDHDVTRGGFGDDTGGFGSAGAGRSGSVAATVATVAVPSAVARRRTSPRVAQSCERRSRP